MFLDDLFMSFVLVFVIAVIVFWSWFILTEQRVNDWIPNKEKTTN